MNSFSNYITRLAAACEYDRQAIREAIRADMRAHNSDLRDIIVDEAMTALDVAADRETIDYDGGRRTSSRSDFERAPAAKRVRVSDADQYLTSVRSEIIDGKRVIFAVDPNYVPLSDRRTGGGDADWYR
jgi:hypothetical protein